MTAMIVSGLLLLAAAISAWIYPPRRHPLLFAVRSGALFLVFLFLWNPQCVHRSKHISKPELVVVQDVSASQKDFLSLSDSVRKFLINDADLKQHFRLRQYWLADSLFHRRPDSLRLATNLHQSLEQLYDLHGAGRRRAWILLTDGLATAGGDYRYMGNRMRDTRNFPVVTGDTARYPDLEIKQVEYNDRTATGNYFPLNLSVRYRNGRQPAETELRISEGNRILQKQKIRLTPGDNYRKFSFRLRTRKAGWHRYQIRLQALDGEKNVQNNVRYVRIRAVDRTAHILILYGKLHPDVGVLRRILEQDKNYRIEIAAQLPRGKTYDLILAVQPSARQVRQLAGRKEPVWWFTGVHAAWPAVNKAGLWFGKRIDFISDELYRPKKVNETGLFRMPPFPGFPLPPLRDVYGKIRLSAQAQVLIQGRSDSNTDAAPLVAVEPQKYSAVTLGQGLWRWYMFEHKNTGKADFTSILVKKIGLFLMNKPQKDLLRVDYSKHYVRGHRPVLRIHALNTLYEPNDAARLRVKVHTPDGKTHDLKPVYEGGMFKVFFPWRAPGFYRFTVFYDDYNLRYHGGLEIDRLPAELRFTGTDTASLARLARSTGGALYFPQDVDKLKKRLLQSAYFKPGVQFRAEKHPLTRHWWLLLLAALFFAVEWFYRKYRGML